MKATQTHTILFPTHSTARPACLPFAGGTTPGPLSHTLPLSHQPFPSRPQRGSYPRPERGEPSVQLPAARTGDNFRPRFDLAPSLSPHLPPPISFTTPPDKKASSLPRNSMTTHTTNQLYS